MKYIFFSLLSLVLSACFWKNNDSCFTDLSIKFSTTISPTQDTFHIGDTLWVESVVPDTMVDFESGIRYNASDFKTSLNIDFEEEMVIDSFFAERFFNVVQLENNVDTVSWVGDRPISFRIEYLHLMGVTRFKVGFIPTKAGLYSTQMSFRKEDYEKIDLDLDCIDVIRDIEITTNGGNGNYHLFNGFVPYPYDSTGFRIRGGFAFRVVE